MWVESRGQLDARSPLTSSGYYFGLMQIGRFSAVPEYMKSVVWMCGNAYNQVLAGGTELVNKSIAINSQQWDLVAGAYFGFGTDVTGMNTSTYMALFRQHVVALTGTTPGGTDWIAPPTPTPGPTQTFGPIATAGPGQFPSGSTLTVGADRINLRVGPGLFYTPFDVLLPGSTVTLLSGPIAANNYDWYQVRTSTGLTGWAAGQLMTLSGTPVAGSSTPTPTATRTPTPTGTAGSQLGQFKVGDPVVVNVASLNLRIAPALTATVLSVMPSGAQGIVTGATVSVGGLLWTPVNITGHGAGWAATQYLMKGVGSTATLTPTASPTATVTPGPTNTQTPMGGPFFGTYIVNVPLLNLRSSAGTSAPIITTLNQGTILQFLGRTATANGFQWYEVRSPNHTGWIASTYVLGTSSTASPSPTLTPTATPTSPGAFIAAYEVSVPLLNLRSAPSLTATILATLTEGTVVQFLGRTAVASGHTWYEVRNATQTGWIAGTYVSSVPPTSTPTATATATRTATPTVTPTPSPTTTPTRTSESEIRPGDTVRVTAGWLNVRSEPSTTSSIVRTVPLGTTGTVLAGPQSGSGYAWHQISTSLGTGWVAGMYIERVIVGVAAAEVELPGLTVSQTPTPSPVPDAPTATTLPDITSTPVASVEPTVIPTETQTQSEPNVEAPTEPPAPPTATATSVLDSDLDGVPDSEDGCPGVADSGFDSDGDGIDDACDPTPLGEPTIPPVVEYQVVSSAGTDTSVSVLTPDAAQPADLVATLTVGGPDANVTFITFWVDGVGTGQVTNATLYMPFASGAGTVSIGVLPATSIDEWSLTYATAPQAGVATTAWAQAGSEVPVDLTGWITSDGAFTIVVSGTVDSAVVLGSKESGWPARLIITAVG
ncbi:hypothetical protein BH23CHL5_BH23CHL5_11210 [soil metagenome]